MAREMADAEAIYRVRFDSIDSEGQTSTSFNGPYSTSGPAVAQKTRYESHVARYNLTNNTVVTVERAICDWQPVSETP